MAPSQKRTRAISDDDDASDLSDDAFSLASAASDDEPDISSALTGGPTTKKRKLGSGPLAPANDSDGDGDDAIEELIRDSIAKRNTKEGAEVVKNAKGGKGKNKLAKGEVGGGSFQSMGLYPWLLRQLTLQGFRTPTPIQRLSIPLLLQSPPRDLVGMARTGSGKSLAFLIPLIQRLGGRHSSTFGARALILLPTRELALQVMKVGKELARGWREGEGGHAGDREGDDGESSKRSQSLRWGLVVGGESLDEQFEMISSNPDVIIATPGRLLHLAVEMNLDLKSVQYVVFDEADRLFEMGFEVALTEIVSRLPAGRQTVLFSATLPKSLVEFARAGLENPRLVRLDADSKLSADLRMAFFSVKQDEKDAALLSLLRDVIGVPQGVPFQTNHHDDEEEDNEASSKKKGKRRAHPQREHAALPHQALVFAATKHHVEYLTNLLSAAGMSVAHIYGSLDQTARAQQMARFRRGTADVLVVTDVAARGIDIPVLAHVVNYDFPHGARVFVHRVGRTARAGRAGWAWSFVTVPELPHLLDLQLFLGRPLRATLPPGGEKDESVFASNLILGAFPRIQLDEDTEHVRALDASSTNLPALRSVMKKGQTMYERSRGRASQQSYRRCKDMTREPRKWGLAGGGGVHPVLLMKGRRKDELKKDVEVEESKADLLAAVGAFRPAETVLEVGPKAKALNADLMRSRRSALEKARARAAVVAVAVNGESEDEDEEGGEHAEVHEEGEDVEMADEAELATVFDTSSSKAHKYRDTNFYMGYSQASAHTDKGYSLRDGASFVEQAAHASFDLAGDEGVAAQRRASLAWDKKKKKFVAGGGVGADNVKMVKTESGVKLPASYRSGRYDEWRKERRVGVPRVGEDEGDNARRFAGGKKFRHTMEKEGRPLDKRDTDYERRSRVMGKRREAQESVPPEERGGKYKPYGGAKDGRGPAAAQRDGKGGKPGLARRGGKPAGRVKNELKNAEQIRRDRAMAEKKKLKNARAPKKGGGKSHGGKGGGRGRR